MANKAKKKPAIVIMIVLIGIALLGGGVYLGYANFIITNYLMTVVGLIMVVLGAMLLIYLIGNYNKFIKYKNKVDESLSLIDIQLKLRFDLIPNLVNTVKGYAKHEQEVFAQVAELRNKALITEDEKEKIELANQTLPKIRHMIAIAENYPELKADAMYRSLMEELVLIEDKIVAARRFYDSNVNEYNTAVEVFPSSIIANIFGHTRLELFKIDAGERLNTHIDM